jgi:hypothetical protein
MKKLLTSAFTLGGIASYAMIGVKLTEDNCFQSYTKYLGLLQTCNQPFNPWNKSARHDCVLKLHKSFIEECMKEKNAANFSIEK